MLPTSSKECMQTKKRAQTGQQQVFPKKLMVTAPPETEQREDQRASDTPVPDVVETDRNGIALETPAAPAPKRTKSSASLASSEFSVVSLALPRPSRPSSAASSGGSTQFSCDSTNSLKSKRSDGKQRGFQISLAMVAPRV